MRKAAVVLVAVGALVAAPAARATFHETKVSEVLLSRDASTTEQFVELQDPAEPYPSASGPYKLIVYGADGAPLGNETLSNTTLAAVAALRPILISTAAFDAAAHTTGDFPLTVALPASGQACFTHGVADMRVHCMQWGTVTTPLSGSGGSVAGAAPPDGSSLQTQCDASAAVAAPTPAAANAQVVAACTDRAPTAHFTFSPTAPTAGRQVTFDGSPSTDPDAGDAVALWEWTFDGESVNASAPTVAHTFATAGAHAVSLTVVDSHGKASASVATTIDVAGGGTRGGGGAPKAFAGVKVSTTKVKVGASRVAAIRVACPAGTTGGCAGRLTLKDGAKRVAAKSFIAAAGKTATVKLKLTAAEARKLRKRHRLRLSLTIAAHDGAGQAARARTVHVTLVRG